MITPGGRGLAFLAGAPRSGTTLLSLVLAKLDGVHAPPEPWLALPLTQLLRRVPGLTPPDSDENLAAIAFLQGFPAERGLDVTRSLLAGAYGELQRRRPGARLLVDKTPRYYRILDHLGALLPEARFVLLARDPLDVAASHKRRWGVDLEALATEEGVRDASFDVFCAPALLSRAPEHLGDRALTLRYEDLVREPAGEVARVCRHLGVPWDPSALDYRDDNAEIEAYGASVLGDREALLQERIHTDSIGRWRTILTPHEASLVVGLVGEDVMRSLGYEVPVPPADPGGARERIRHALRARDAGAAPGGWPGVHAGERARVDLAARLQEVVRTAERARRQSAELESELAEARAVGRSARAEARRLAGELRAARRALDRVETLWPWLERTEETAVDRPRISVVTPTRNSPRWIERTILSVLAQDYPDFEHIVVDGGDDEETPAILRRYPHVRHVRAPDLGQAHAINRGLLLATGEILAYLNADDLYRPGAFEAVANALSDPATSVVVGDCDLVDADERPVAHLAARMNSVEDLWRYWGWDRWYCVPQQSVFWRRDVLSETGLFDVGLHYTMDYEMWVRMARRHRFAVVGRTLAAFRLHPDAKTVAQAPGLYLEHRRAARRHWPPPWRPARWRLEVGSLRYTGGKLLDVAEHLALSGPEGRRALGLLGAAVRRWPLTALDPRTALSALSALTRGGPHRWAALVHRAYLRLRWMARGRPAPGIRVAPPGDAGARDGGTEGTAPAGRRGDATGHPDPGADAGPASHRS